MDNDDIDLTSPRDKEKAEKAARDFHRHSKAKERLLVQEQYVIEHARYPSQELLDELTGFHSGDKTKKDARHEAWLKKMAEKDNNKNNDKGFGKA